MSSFDDAVILLLSKKIEEMRSRVSEQIVSGQCESFDQYRDYSGYVRALTDVLLTIEDSKTEIRKG